MRVHGGAERKPMATIDTMETPGRDAAAVDVVVPTLRRPDDLARCLQALLAQTVSAERIVVVVRADDDTSLAVLAAYPDSAVVPVTVEEPGVNAALRAGVAATTAEIVAFTDDDAVAPADWLERIVAAFADPGVGAVGGRDRIADQDEPAEVEVGVWRGLRAVGNHHIGSGSVRPVDFLKGVNMAYRRDVLALPRGTHLRSIGAQPGFELVMGAVVGASGSRILYDPNLVVEHRPAPRVGTGRGTVDAAAVSDDAAHHVLAAAVVGRWRAVGVASYLVAVGTNDTPGIVRAAVGFVRGESHLGARVAATARGVLTGLRLLARPRAHVVSADVLACPSRPRVVIVAHRVDDSGGQERAAAAVIGRSADAVDYQVVAANLSPELSESVAWERVPLPPGPFVVRYVWFGLIAGLITARLRRRGDVIVHTIGVVIPNRVDVISVHYCWAEAVATEARPAPRGRLRHLAQHLTAIVSLAAERRAMKPGRVRVPAAVSERTADEIRRHHRRDDVVVVPNGVDTVRFAPDASARVEVRREIGVDDETFVVTFVGGDWLRKGLDLTIAAFARAGADVGGHAELWVVGEDDPDIARHAAREAECGERVRTLGFRADVERILAATDALVTPSRYETFGLVALEAAAVGVPVVTTPGAAPAEVVAALPGCLVVDGSIDVIESALRYLLVDPRRAAGIGASLVPVATASSWDRSVAATLDIYAHLIPPAPRQSLP
jgi:glycosyltransferase involved in cell wall biosynthesis